VKRLGLILAGLCAVGAAHADEKPSAQAPLIQDGGDVRPPKPPAPTHVPRRLSLGPWGYESYESGPPSVVDVDIPRFQTEVEVRAKPMDPIALTAKLQWWFRDVSLTHGAVPATSTAPSLQEMKDYRPHPPDSVDLVPVVQWLTEKLNKKKN
jgi:hypothetical protein